MKLAGLENSYKLEKRKTRKIILQIIFFAMRVVIFTILYGRVGNKNVWNVHSRVEISDIAYLFLLSAFVLYLFIKSIVIGNIYKYYLSIIVLINNAAVTLRIPVFEPSDRSGVYWRAYLMLAILYLMEATASIIVLYYERNENSIDLFKKIGLNPRINNAFAARKRLETLGEINVFMSTLLQSWVWIPPTNNGLRWLVAVRIIDKFVTYVQQMCISVNFNGENIRQRIAAICLSIVNIAFPTVLFVWEQIIQRRHLPIQSDFNKFIYVDMFLIAFFMTVFLIQDYNRFGSGLKEQMACRTKRLHLNTS